MITVDFKDVLYKALPIDAQDLTSAVDIVVVGDKAGLEPDSIICSDTYGEVVMPNQYVASPAVASFVHEQDATYHMKKSVKLADFFDPFLKVTDLSYDLYSVLPTPIDSKLVLRVYRLFPAPEVVPTALSDDDNSTYLSNTAPAGQQIYSTWLIGNTYQGHMHSALGFRFIYSMLLSNTNPAPYIEIHHSQTCTDADSVVHQLAAVARYNIPNTEGSINDIYGILPIPIFWDPDNGYTAISQTTYITMFANDSNFTGPGTLKVYEWFPLIIDYDKLQNVASAEIKLPAIRPAQVVVKGYSAPDTSLTVSGYPGGDITAAVASVEYKHDMENGLITVYSLEQTTLIRESDYGQARRALDIQVNNRVKLSQQGVKSVKPLIY